MPKVQSIIAKALRIDPTQVTDQLAMAGNPSWDSMKHMEIVVGIEEAYGVQFEFEEIAEMLSVGGIRATLAKRSLS